MGRNGKRWMMILVMTTGLLCAGLGISLLEQAGRDTYVQAKQEPERKSETETESEGETDAKSESEAGAEAESETESETETESESETESKTEAESGSETESEKETETEAESGNETESEKETETEAESESETENITEAESENETESKTEAGSGSETENITEAGSENETEPEPESESESVAETEEAPETELPETETEVPETEAPETEAPETEAPETEAPETEAPETEAPETEAPETEAPETETPETEAPALETEEQEPVPEQVKRGAHYDISGDDGAWHRDEKGRLWIRGGTSLRVFPLPGSGYNTGKSKDSVKKDGEISFRLKQVDGDGNVLKKSVRVTEPYFVDSEAPSATIQATGSRGDSCIYASGASAVSISVEPDTKSGLKSCFYKIVPCAADGSIPSAVQEGGWTECGASASFQISTDGRYRVYVKTQDRVGNVAFTGSEIICVDSIRPQLSVTGVEDQTANTGEVSIRVSCSDDYYKPGSLKAGITGVNQGYSPTVSSRGSDASGEWIEFHDFPNLNEYDDVYEVNVSAEDLSGNRTESQMQFSLNRYGSVYDLSDETKELLQQYFLPKAGSIVFYETNIDYVGESAIYCRRDGEMCALEKGKDYSVTMEGTADTWKRYCYTIPASYFSQEGVYELLLTSRDASDHESDTDIQQKRVTFVLDWTAPNCRVSGIKSGGIYESEKVNMQIFPSDNMGLSDMKIYHNSQLLQENTKGPSADEPVQLTLEEEDDWQTVQIWLRDQAGNEYWSREMPVYVSSANLAVPAYRKMKKSAMEIATGGTEEPFEMEVQTESETESEAEPETETQTGEEKETETEEREKAIPESSPIDTQGRIFLFIGILAFVIVAAVLLICSKKKAK